jgi:hypothetical protein
MITNDACLKQVWQMYRRWTLVNKLWCCPYCGVKEGGLHEEGCDGCRVLTHADYMVLDMKNRP